MARQAGMTLIELTVVLLVLVGLAGLMIPYVSGFVGKTHDATGSSNIAGVGNAITRFETEFGSYPENMDSLILGAGATGGLVIDYSMCDVMNMGTCTDMGAYGITPVDLTAVNASNDSALANAEVCGSLAKAGITSVVDMAASSVAGFNATFSNSAGVVGIANSMMNTCNMAGAGGTVAEIAAANVADGLGIDTTDKRYVIFGVGQSSELLGKTMQEAPVHFAKNADMNASQAYNRFGAIFEVDRDINTALASADAMRAKYVGTVMLMSKVVGLQEELGNYYQTTTDAAN